MMASVGRSGRRNQIPCTMEAYTLTPTPPLVAAIKKALAQAGDALGVFLGLNLELHGAQGAALVGGGTPLDLSKQTRGDWLALVRWLVEKGGRVHVVEEACGFGWQFHRDLSAAGAQTLVSAPEALNGKRKTDKRDARQLAMLLYDLWRIETGLIRLEDVGLVAADTTAGMITNQSPEALMN